MKNCKYMHRPESHTRLQRLTHSMIVVLEFSSFTISRLARHSFKHLAVTLADLCTAMMCDWVHLQRLTCGP